MKKPRLLDLFCCEGGAGMGYALAGFEVVGVDIAPQPKYPFEFHQADALEFLREHGNEFDAIHASPPCQAHSSTQRIRGNEHPDLIEPTRDELKRNGVPWVIENVPGAPLLSPVVLCGSMFGLPLRRHRLFETSFPVPMPPLCDHSGPAITIIGHGVYDSRLGVRHKGAKSLGYQAARDAMNTPWMSWDKLSQAIPPAYTEWLGRELMGAVRRSRAA